MSKATAFKQFLGREGAEMDEIGEIVSENPELIFQLEEAPEMIVPVLLGIFARKVAARGRSYTKRCSIFVR